MWNAIGENNILKFKNAICEAKIRVFSDSGWIIGIYWLLIDILKVMTGIGRSGEEFCDIEMYAVWRWGGRTEYGSSFAISTWSLQRGCSCSNDSKVTKFGMGSKCCCYPIPMVSSCILFSLFFFFFCCRRRDYNFLVYVEMQARKDLVHCWSILLKQKVDSRYCSVEYIENHFEFLDFLVVW